MKNAFLCIFCSRLTGMLLMGSWGSNKLILRVIPSFCAPRQHFSANISKSVKTWNFKVYSKNAEKWPIFWEKIEILKLIPSTCVNANYVFHESFLHILSFILSPSALSLDTLNDFYSFLKIHIFFNIWHFLGIVKDSLRNH